MLPVLPDPSLQIVEASQCYCIDWKCTHYGRSEASKKVGVAMHSVLTENHLLHCGRLFSGAYLDLSLHYIYGVADKPTKGAS